MKKKLFNYLAIWVVIFMGVIFVSCDKDDDNSPLVGSWSCSNHYYGGSYGGTDTYVFKSDGTYMWSCTGDWWSDQNGRYSYNEDEGILTINRSATEIYYVISLTQSSFTMMDEEGDYYTYYKN